MPEPEDAPPEASFLATSPTVDGLTADHQADLVWRGADGSVFFLWAPPPEAAGARTFTLNRAYLVRQNGEVFWAFLNPEGVYAHWGSPLNRFVIMKHVRQTVDVPQEHHSDGPATVAELISRSSDGRELVRITYASLMGDAPNHVETPSWLVYFPASGPPVLASEDIGADRGWHLGYINEFVSQKFDVTWHEPADPVPFHLPVQRTRMREFRGDDEQSIGCAIYSDADWTGLFPLGGIRVSGTSYAIADGRTDLQSLASTLVLLNSAWIDSDWVTPESRKYARRRWREEIARSNPELPPDQLVTAGTHISIPDESAMNRDILDQVRLLQKQQPRGR